MLLSSNVLAFEESEAYKKYQENCNGLDYLQDLCIEPFVPVKTCMYLFGSPISVESALEGHKPIGYFKPVTVCRSRFNLKANYVPSLSKNPQEAYLKALEVLSE